MALTLAPRTPTTIPLEVPGVIPESLRGMSLAKVEQTLLFHGNTKRPLAEFFRVTGDANDEHVVFAGDCSGVHFLGAQMTCGRITIEGPAGRHVGSQMRGGEIDVRGSVSDFAGCEMRRGLLRVRGDAGDFVGAAYRGSRKGMRGGTILVHGNAGQEIGHTMRRGLIAIGGRAGDFIGFNMLAGTIIVGGSVGARHGAGMKRGTILLLAELRPTLLPSFRHATRYLPPFVPLLAQELARLDFTSLAPQLVDSFDSYSGDLIEGGRGELLLRAA